MAPPHPALIDLAAGRPAGRVADGPRFLDSAVEHRLAGLAFWATTTGDLEIDGATRRALAEAKLAAAARNAAIERTASGAIGELRAAGWDAAIFKGVATEKRWYPDAGTRPTGDVDLLLAPPAWTALDDVISALAPDHGLAGKAQRLADTGRIQSIDVLRDGIWVDLHIDPIKVGLRLPGIEAIWNRSEYLSIDGLECRALDAGTSLLQAAIHLLKDRFARLYTFADIARISASGAVDWDWVQEFAADAGLAVHLNETLRVVAKTLQIEIPYRRDAMSRPWRLIWREKTRLRGNVGMARRVRTHYWIPLTMPGRRWEAVRWWTRIVVPPADIVEYMHPDTSGPYPWRLVQYRSRLAWERHVRNREQRRAGE